MAGAIKILAKETAIYGLSSIVGRLLNWCFVFLYINALKSTADYGVVTNLYAYMALLLIILTYGLETGFFRFANDKELNNPQLVYSTSLISLITTSSLFFVAVLAFLTPITNVIAVGGHEDCVWMLALIIGVDAFTSLPFAMLRYKRKAIRYAVIKLASIGVNILFNLFFFLACPAIYKSNSEAISWFFNPDKLVVYIFVSNLISTLLTLVLLMPEIIAVRLKFSFAIWRRIIVYSFPLLILGVAGIMNQTFDKMFYPYLASDRPDFMGELGVYGAVFKIAIVMVMFTQAFRFAYEPFVFSKNREDGEKSTAIYADTMKYFIIFTLFIFLGVTFYLDIVKFIIPESYYVGLMIVPIVMAAEMFYGVFFNLSMWYKLTDRTYWGAIFSIVGLIVTAAINIIYVPKYGYLASAWGAFFSYLIMMVASYIIGQHYYKIKYNISRIAIYFAMTIVLFLLYKYINICNIFALYSFRSVLLLLYVVLVLKIERVNLKGLLNRKG